MSSPNLRVVADENTPTSSMVPDDPPTTPGDTFDPLLDLGEMELKDDERRHMPADNANEEGALQRMLRPILYGVGGIIALIVVAILFIRLSASPDTANVTPSISAKVDVLEAAIHNAASTGLAHGSDQQVTSADEAPAENVAVLPALPAPSTPTNTPVSTPEPLPEPTIPHALIMEMSATVSALQQIISDVRATIADQQERVGEVQATLAQLQATTVEDRTHIDRLSREIADIRRAVTEANATKSRETQALQRQLSLQRKAAKELQAAPKVRPGFQLASVTQWGEDALATFSYNGQLQVLGKGDVLDGWTLVRIDGNTVRVVRAADGATATLVKGA
ncbi:MAG: hypothetical protein AB7T07_15165 [Steroidobacteraceae bacterium]